MHLLFYQTLQTTDSGAEREPPENNAKVRQLTKCVCVSVVSKLNMCSSLAGFLEGCTSVLLQYKVCFTVLKRNAADVHYDLWEVLHF